MVPYMMTVGTNVSGGKRSVCINGLTFIIESMHDGSVKGVDRYRYYLPDGESYTHPTESGCFLMILKWLSGDVWRNADGTPFQF